jgi:hypothetical protein
MAPLEEIHNGVKPQKSYLKERTNCCSSPKPKPLNEQPYKPLKPIQRIQRSYSRERKIDIILFQEHHRIQSIDLDTGLLVYKPLTFEQMSAFWKVLEVNIQR